MRMRLPSSLSIAGVMSDRLNGSSFFMSSLTVSNVMSRIACDLAIVGRDAGRSTGAPGVAVVAVLVATVVVAVVAMLVVVVGFAATFGVIAPDSLDSGADRGAAGKLESPQPAAQISIVTALKPPKHRQQAL